jgi:hypothetical protein
MLAPHQTNKMATRVNLNKKKYKFKLIFLKKKLKKKEKKKRGLAVRHPQPTLGVAVASPEAGGRGVQTIITDGYWLKPLTANHLAVIEFYQPQPLTA